MQELLKKTLACYSKGPSRYYRIPGIVVTAKGTIIVYFEMRLSSSDWSTRAIGMRRSVDNGETWSPLEIIATTDSEVAVNNPVMIASKDGTVYFMWEENYNFG